MQNRAWIPLFILDLLLVVVFAALGRSSHAETLDAAGILGTAGPFLLALAAFSAVTRVWREPARLWPHGVVLWVGTVVLGLGLRVLFGATAALPFVIVATIVLGVFLLGRRGLTLLLLRRKVRANQPVN
jgi:hypothetical protein